MPWFVIAVFCVKKALCDSSQKALVDVLLENIHSLDFDVFRSDESTGAGQSNGEGVDVGLFGKDEFAFQFVEASGDGEAGDGDLFLAIEIEA